MGARADLTRLEGLCCPSMLLNFVEKALMNNPVRAAVQRRFEARRLLALGGRVDGGRALEIGCGRGVGCEIVQDVFGALTVDGFDLDPDMVRRARTRLARRDGIRLWIGDAERIAAPSSTYDAVFDFGIIHHVPRWRGVLREARRVLKPGGRFFAEEVLVNFIAHPLWRRILDHPQEDRFDHDGFRAALVEAGFRVLGTRELWGDFAWFVAARDRRRLASARALPSSLLLFSPGSKLRPLLVEPLPLPLEVLREPRRRHDALERRRIPRKLETGVVGRDPILEPFLGAQVEAEPLALRAERLGHAEVPRVPERTAELVLGLAVQHADALRGPPEAELAPDEPEEGA